MCTHGERPEFPLETQNVRGYLLTLNDWLGTCVVFNDSSIQENMENEFML